MRLCFVAKRWNTSLFVAIKWIPHCVPKKIACIALWADSGFDSAVMITTTIMILIQGGQHGLPSVWLRLELCDNQDSEEDVDGGDNHNYDIDQKGHSKDYDNDYNTQNHHHHPMINTFEDTGDQQSRKEQQESLELCPSPRLLMITKLPDFYTTLSNKVGFSIITIIVIILRCGLDAESGGLAAHTGLLLVLRCLSLPSESPSESSWNDQHHRDDYNQLVGEREVEGEERVIATSQTFKVVTITIIIITIIIGTIIIIVMTVMSMMTLVHCLNLWRLTGAKSTRWQWTDQQCFRVTKVRSTFLQFFSIIFRYGSLDIYLESFVILRAVKIDCWSLRPRNMIQPFLRRQTLIRGEEGLCVLKEIGKVLIPRSDSHTIASFKPVSTQRSSWTASLAN